MSDIPDRQGDTLQALILDAGKFPIVRVPRGFHGMTGRIALPDGGNMFVMVTSIDRHYELSVEGDLALARPQQTQLNRALPDIFLVAVHWSDEAKAAGKGNGVLIVKDVSILEQPTRFTVSMGEAAVELNS